VGVIIELFNISIGLPAVKSTGTYCHPLRTWERLIYLPKKIKLSAKKKGKRQMITDGRTSANCQQQFFSMKCSIENFFLFVFLISMWFQCLLEYTKILILDVQLMDGLCIYQVKSSQIYLYSAFHNTNCIKAASQYQSRQLNSVCLFMKKTIKFGRAEQWYDGSFNLNIIIMIINH